MTSLVRIVRSLCPAGAVVYRTAVNAPGVREETVAGTTTLEIAGITTPAAAPATAEADGYFAPVGEFSACSNPSSMEPAWHLTPKSKSPPTADLVASQKPSAGACRKSPSAILVEVCYYLPDAAPDADDVHIPYGVEAGQSDG